MKRILVVDDNRVGRALIKEVLETPSRRIFEACNGQQALEMVAKTKPDLVLLDIGMPLLDGYSALRQIRRDPKFADVKVVALTAFAMQGDREKALAAGFDDYITKPVRAAALRKQVERLLSNSDPSLSPPGTN